MHATCPSAFTIFPSYEFAAKAAAANSAYDEDWTYEVLEINDGRFIVAIKDEDGLPVGNLLIAH
jgi:hypothetical protein